MEIPKMKPSPVESKTVKNIGYDGANRILYIEFKSGPKIYSYADFLPKKYKDLLAATKIGDYVAKEVIPNHYCIPVELLDRSTQNVYFEANK